MSHTTLRSGYTELVERLNRFPQGAPPSDTLYKILQILFSEREAQLVALLPIKPFTAEKASQGWKMDLTETRKVLDELSSRAILVDVEWDGKTTYTLPPPMAGFFEFSMMRLRAMLIKKYWVNCSISISMSKRNLSARYLSAAKPSLGGSSCKNLFFHRKIPCTCWIMNAPARSSTLQVTAELAYVIVATR